MTNTTVAPIYAPALQAAGYKTAMMGKYLNGYHPGKHPIPVGWSDWFVVGGGGYSGMSNTNSNANANANAKSFSNTNIDSNTHTECKATDLCRDSLV